MTADDRKFYLILVCFVAAPLLAGWLGIDSYTPPPVEALMNEAAEVTSASE